VVHLKTICLTIPQETSAGITRTRTFRELSGTSRSARVSEYAAIDKDGICFTCQGIIFSDLPQIF